MRLTASISVSGTVASPPKTRSTQFRFVPGCPPHCSYRNMTVQDVIFEADTWFGSKSQEQAVAVANSSDSPPGLVFAGPPLSLWRSPRGPHEMSLSVFDMDRYMVTFLVDGPELSHVRTVRPWSHAPPTATRPRCC